MKYCTKCVMPDTVLVYLLMKMVFAQLVSLMSEEKN